jgi:hypothetical protein
MTDRELDELYWTKPDRFIALRTKMSSAAKRRGDSDTARRISITNKPTTAAWIVNRLAIGHRETRERLGDLGDRLRVAHSAMDGDQIRDLSAEQRRLIDQLSRVAFDAAELRNPSPAIRDDVGATLQAAIADPEVRAALGRLTRPERWSGFGAVDGAAPVHGAGRKKRSSRPAQPGAASAENEPGTSTAAKQAADREREDRSRAARERRESLAAAVAAAEQAKSEADDALVGQRAEFAAARSRRAEARASLRAAERECEKAERGYGKAQEASRDAAGLLREAKAQLKRARSERGQG